MFFMGAKEKILKYLEYKGISQGKFCRDINVSNGFLGSGIHIGSDKLTSIRDNYSDLNMNWLIYNEGDMIFKEEYIPFDNKMVVNEIRETYQYKESCNEKLVSIQTKLIEVQDELIKSQRELTKYIKKNANH